MATKKRYSPPRTIGLTQSGKAPTRGASLPRSQSAELISQLKASGLSYSEIGRRLGRDSSLISQIAAGKKPGRNLEAALAEIKSGKQKPSAEPARRQTKAGTPARVRQSANPNPKPRLLKDKYGRIKNAPATARARVLEDRLAKIALAGGKVSFRLTLDSGAVVVVFRKGGIWAQRAIREALNHPDGILGWLADSAEDLTYSAEEGAIVGVEINAIY